MKCPACKNPLREKSAGGMTLDLCYGGCGGIWFDAGELERVDVRAGSTLHSIWQVPAGRVTQTEPRFCPKCPGQVLERKWFSEKREVEIDQCPRCRGIWLDAGEFTRVQAETRSASTPAPGWAAAMAAAAAVIRAGSASA